MTIEEVSAKLEEMLASLPEEERHRFGEGLIAGYVAQAEQTLTLAEALAHAMDAWGIVIVVFDKRGARTRNAVRVDLPNKERAAVCDAIDGLLTAMSGVLDAKLARIET
jgi:hypothetical protein